MMAAAFSLSMRGSGTNPTFVGGFRRVGSSLLGISMAPETSGARAAADRLVSLRADVQFILDIPPSLGAMTKG
jgi:hypothetical protein